MEGFGVVGSRGKGVFGGDGGADGPEVDGGGAVVGYDCVADFRRGGGGGKSGGEGCEGEGGDEMHLVVGLSRVG